MSENLKCKKTDNYKPKLNTTEDIESVIEPITELDIKNFFKTLNEENLDKCLEELTWLSDVSKQNFKEIINYMVIRKTPISKDI